MTNDNYANPSGAQQGIPRDRRDRRESRQQPLGEADYHGRYLNIQPGDQLIFENRGIDKDSSDLITLTNISSGFVAFKVKTTAPEKFRVKPSFGCIEAGSSRTVEITIQQGFLMTAQRDKFLVMSSSLDQVPKSQNELIEYWHGVLSDDAMSENVEEHRLRCQIVSSTENHVDSGGDRKNNSSPTNSSAPVPPIVLEKLEAINAKVDRLMALQHESSNSPVLATQWNVFTVGMAVIILYVGIHLIKLVLGV